MEKTIFKHLEGDVSQSQPVNEIRQPSAKGNRSGMAGEEVMPEACNVKPDSVLSRHTSLPLS